MSLVNLVGGGGGGLTTTATLLVGSLITTVGSSAGGLPGSHPGVTEHFGENNKFQNSIQD